MNAAAQLTRLLAEWQRLTELEGAAILSENWPEVAQHQSAKALLGPDITQALEQFRAARPGGQTPAPATPDPFAAAAAPLLALETRNRDALRAKCQRKRAELAAASQTTRNLQGLRRAYGGANAHLWQSYS